MEGQKKVPPFQRSRRKKRSRTLDLSITDADVPTARRQCERRQVQARAHWPGVVCPWQHAEGPRFVARPSPLPLPPGAPGHVEPVLGVGRCADATRTFIRRTTHLALFPFAARRTLCLDGADGCAGDCRPGPPINPAHLPSDTPSRSATRTFTQAGS